MLFHEGGATEDWARKLAFMGEYKERLAEAIRMAKSDREKLAGALSISVQAVGQVLRGDTRAFSAANNAKAARFLAVSPYWLATGEGSARDGEGLREALSEEAVMHGAAWDRMNPAERRRLHFLMMASREGVEPKNIKPARDFRGGMSNYGDLDEGKEESSDG